jgi:membrane-associated phospholipid phosphatase
MLAKGALLTCCWNLAISTALANMCAPSLFAQQNDTRNLRTALRESGASSADSGKASNENSANALQPEKAASSTSLGGLTRNFVRDQQAIWTSPSQVRFPDTVWLAPLSGVAAGLFVTDRQVSGHLNKNLGTQQHYRHVATAGAGALVGIGGGLALWGMATRNEHQKETGFLAGEAAIDGLVMAEALKYTFQRQRPYQGNGAGHFFDGGASFPSEHAAAAWSIAAIIAHEYPGALPGLFSYGLASAVSLSRIRSRDHFPSDVLVGSAMGYLISQYVYRKHHDPELGGTEWRSIGEMVREKESSPGYMGSPYVPLDSWIYPALDRLAGMGLIDTGFAGLRPWTRLDIQRMLSEAGDKLGGDGGENAAASQILETLQREFRADTEQLAGELGGAFRMESVYSRTEYISGQPLNDGYHFAQTQINDFGRPFGQGWNTINGFSAYTSAGPWVAYVRGEWQTAGGLPALPLAAREAVQNADFLPPQLLPPGTPQLPVSQFHLLDTYIGLNLSNWMFSFGKQSLTWGAGEGGSLTLSNNAEPINMFRLNRVVPLELPSILHWLGPMRLEAFLGQLSGYELMLTPTGYVGQFGAGLPKQPFIHGENISFKPTRNFEFGFYRTTIFGGPGYPFTLKSLTRSLFNTSNAIAGEPDKPGDRTSGLDFSYRLPRLRDWVSFYADGYTDDQFSPIAYADRSAWHAGLYFSHFPKLSKLDLRVEGVYTDIPGARGRVSIGPGSFYYNGTWRSGYTNNGYLIGSWIGRGGQGAQAWTNYWFNARSRLQFNFRHQKVSQQFIPNGGTLTDFGARGDYWLRGAVGLSAWVQYEHWLFPVIQPNAARDVTTAVQVSFQPLKVFRHSRIGSEEDALSEVGSRP